jgi:hypothetical protein
MGLCCRKSLEGTSVMTTGDNSAWLARGLKSITSAAKPDSVKAIVSNAERALTLQSINEETLALLKRASWRRLAELAGQDVEDQLVRRWFQGLAAFEALTGKPASRTRPMLERHGARKAFEKLVDRKGETSGFTDMVEAGLHDMTAEWIVLEHGDAFPSRIHDIAKQRLAGVGVSPPSSLRPDNPPHPALS